MKHHFPQTMKALFHDRESNKLILKQANVPIPSKGEVLIKMITAPVNPSDLARLKNKISDNFIPGVEGCGRVIAAGKGLLPKLWLGKRVACTSTHEYSGTWAEYMVTPAANCFPVNDKIPDEQASMMLVNPMTALAFIDIARKDNHKAIINTAAASALGRILNRMAKKYGITVINIVKNIKQAEILKNIGASHILISSDKDFISRYYSVSRALNATLLFDAVGGKEASLLIDALPEKSSVIIYGNLSKEPLEIMHKSLIPDNKNISGFFLGHWAKEKGLLKSVRNILKIRHLLSNDMHTNINQAFPLEKGQEALETYLSNMTKGKVVLVIGG